MERKPKPMTLANAIAHTSMPTYGMKVPVEIQVFDMGGYFAGRVPAQVMLLTRYNERQGLHTGLFYCTFAALWVGCGVRVIVDAVFGLDEAPNEWVITSAFVDTGKVNKEVGN